MIKTVCPGFGRELQIYQKPHHNSDTHGVAGSILSKFALI